MNGYRPNSFVSYAGLLMALTCSSVASAFDATIYQDKIFGVNITTDVVYDGVNSLALNVYEPTGTNVPVIKPGLVLVHGGAWALGSKDDDDLAGGGNSNTAMHEYAQEFARRGYVCVSINYRLFIDGLFPGTGLLAGIDTTSLTVLLNAILSASLTTTQVQNELEVSATDTVSAINWLITNAGTYGVDTTRIAVGGWSAGGFNSLFATYVANAPVAAVWVNSANMGEDGNEALFITGADSTPAIAFHGTVDTVLPFTTDLRDAFVTAGITHEFYAMTGEGHFYDRTKVVSDTPSRAVPDTLENLVADFFFTQMNLAPIGGSVVVLPATSNRGLMVSVALLLVVGLTVLLRSRSEVPTAKE